MAITRLLRATRQYLDLPRGNVSPSTQIGDNLLGKLAVVSVEVMPATFAHNFVRCGSCRRTKARVSLVAATGRRSPMLLAARPNVSKLAGFAVQIYKTLVLLPLAVDDFKTDHPAPGSDRSPLEVSASLNCRQRGRRNSPDSAAVVQRRHNPAAWRPIAAGRLCRCATRPYARSVAHAGSPRCSRSAARGL